MSEHAQDCLHRSHAKVSDPDKLRSIVEDLQNVGQSLQKENNALQVESKSRKNKHQKEVENLRKDIKARDKKLEGLGYCTCSSAGPRWITAEQDFPGSKSKVVFFDGQTFQVRMAKQLQDNRVIISRFSSLRWPGTVYVYTDSPLAMLQSSDLRVRVTSNKRQPEGLLKSKRIRLSRMPLRTKIQVFTGQIKWLFLIQADSRRTTGSSDDSNKKSADTNLP